LAALGESGPGGGEARIGLERTGKGFLIYRGGKHNGQHYRAAASAAKGAIMSHPKDRRERFLIGVNKGRKRVALWFTSDSEAKAGQERHHRDTTKRCGRRCCANPRKWEGIKTLQEKKIDERDEKELSF